VNSLILNLCSGLIGAILGAAIVVFVEWRFAVRTKREDIAKVLRKVRRKVELDRLDMNGCFAVFKESRDQIEDAVSIYLCYLLRRTEVDEAIRVYCGYSKDHPFRSVNKMPVSREEFLDRLDLLEAAVRIRDSKTRQPRK
jgi:hypothetical protein